MFERFVLCDQLVIFSTKHCFISLDSEEEAETEDVVRKKKGDGGREGEKCD